MKRQKKKTKVPTKAKVPQPTTTEQHIPGKDGVDRRRFLTSLRNWGIASFAVGGTGWFVADGFAKTAQELDLTTIGNGIPAVVQIHDPECPKCLALQREARDAVCEIGEHQLQYKVANIRRPSGRKLANEHGVGHVTLLLMDGDGNRMMTLRGENTSGNLFYVFDRHVKKYGNTTAQPTG